MMKEKKEKILKQDLINYYAIKILDVIHMKKFKNINLNYVIIKIYVHLY